MSEKDHVTRELCDERTKRIEQLIQSMKTDILLAMKKEHSMGWKAKATIIAAAILSAASIIVAIIQCYA